MARPMSVDRTKWLQMVQAYRLTPGDAASVARLTGVSPKVARRAWAQGWDRCEWAIPIREVIEREVAAGRALAEATIEEARRDDAARRRENKVTEDAGEKRSRRGRTGPSRRASATKGSAKAARAEAAELEAQVEAIMRGFEAEVSAEIAARCAKQVRAAELTLVSVNLMGLAELSKSMLLLSLRIIDVVKSLAEEPIDELPLRDRLAFLREYVRAQGDCANTAGNLMAMWRLHHDKPTQIVAVEDGRTNMPDDQLARIVVRAQKLIDEQGPFRGFWEDEDEAIEAAERSEDEDDADER